MTFGASLALLGGMLTQPGIAAADPIYLVDSWTYPGNLHDPGTTSIGQSVTIPADGENYNTVGGRFANYSGGGKGMTLTLKADGPAGEVLVSEAILGLKDNVWVAVTSPRRSHPAPTTSRPACPTARWPGGRRARTSTPGRGAAQRQPRPGDRTISIEAVVPLGEGELRFEGAPPVLSPSGTTPPTCTQRRRPASARAS
ncbi:hypothetical protein G7085_06410 [Tessaracoccus sp. HDW20]|uniref:hypothetical protein n=1 Tax=Tessaracoccus coleopterorum TaxID=2714950 RepID=UPI0018D2CE89|nr:hypothetical protein [Tessaracoccus coleopterorum]NHB84360.1 hypothetical protein [Tessaracoccus coleopterorum]